MFNSGTSHPLFWTKSFAWDRASRAMLLLVACGAALGLGVAGIFLDRNSTAAFVTRNAVPTLTRTSLLIAMCAGATLTALWGGVTLARRRGAGIAALETVGRVLAPSCVLPWLPSLFTPAWHAEPLPYLIQLLLVVLLAERSIRISLTELLNWWGTDTPILSVKPENRRWPPLVIVLIGATGYAAFFSYYTIVNHHALRTSAFDLGILVNFSYNTLIGELARAPLFAGDIPHNYFSAHAVFAMFLWMPFFAISPTAETLLIYQAVLLGFAAVPLYLFAATQVARHHAVVIALAYLLFAPLHQPNFYDFHDILTTVFFQFWLYFALATHRTTLAIVMVVVLCAHREDMAVGMASLGLFLALSGVRPGFGLILSAVTAVWFGIIKFILMPLWGQNTFFANIYKDLMGPSESGYGAALRTMLTNPSYFAKTLVKEVKLVYFLHMTAPLVLLPLRKPIFWILMLVGCLITLFTTGYAPTTSIAFQYTAHWVPWLFGATVLSIRLLGRGEGGRIRQHAAIAALALGVLSHSYIFGALFKHEHFKGGFRRVQFSPTEQDISKYNALLDLRSLIPQEASVMGTEHVAAHVAARRDAYTSRVHAVAADYLLLDRDNIGDNDRRHLNRVLAEKPYGLVSNKRSLYLFKREHRGVGTDAALKALGISAGDGSSTPN